MRNLWLPLLVLAGPVCADTLILRDGSRIEGTMLSADGRTLSFVANDGARRNYNLSTVQEVAFGAPEDSTRSRTEISGSREELFDRLGRDIETVMERATLSARQRDMLEDARIVISRTGDDLRDNRNVNAREVRTALDNVRYVINGSGIRAQDRTMVLDGIARIREQYSEYGTSGSRSRTR